MFMTLILKTIILYFVILTCYRFMGKKEVGELNIIDLIVTILIAELAAISIEEDSSLINSIIPILVLSVLEILLSFISLKSEKFRNFIDGKPSVIIKNGIVNFSVMTKLRYSLDDLLSQLRVKGIKSIEEIDYAILENNGELSIFQNTKDYPLPFILDGKIDYNVLREIGKSKLWLETVLNKNFLKVEDIFYAFLTKKKIFIIKKADLR